MSRTDNTDFRVRPGRVRDRGARAKPRVQSFITQALRAAAKANGGPVPLSRMRGERRGTQRQARKGRCCRIGRGQAAADRLKLAAGMRRSGDRARRAIVKARIVRLKVGSRAADAHIRYLERDGTTRDGERGRLYGSDTDRADGRAFTERGREDRHQFRFIIAPEDGDQLSDLRAFTRDLVRQMEEDLGTRLDWVAVDHFNTGHPHTHVVVRGRDELGKDLIIAQDYITDGMRHRAQEFVTLELGPETDLELRARLTAEISADRFTRIDRAMLTEASDQVLDLRPEVGQAGADFDKALRLGRLKKLERIGLVKETQPGVWFISEKTEPYMRALGERHDIIRGINRALAEREQERDLGSIVLHGQKLDTPVTGRVIDKRLADELGDRIGITIDGIDGRVHHVTLRDAATAEEAQVGRIVEVSPAPSQRPADRNIAETARGLGSYRPSLHRALARSDKVPVPGGDYDAYVDAHVRRLEALRRAGIVERLGSDSWDIPKAFEARAAAYDASRSPQVTVRVLSAYDLDRQVTSDGATWLDRRILSGGRSGLADTGFGAEVRRAMEERTDELIRRGHARRIEDGALRVRANLIGTLSQQEIERAGRDLAGERGLRFKPTADGDSVRGKLVGSAQLASGRFAMIDDGLNFSLVPWRPVIEREIGREVFGVMRGNDISWQLGRARGLGIGV